MSMMHLPALARRAMLGACAFTVAAGVALSSAAGQELTLRYGHMNPPNSIPGMQAEWLAEAIARHTDDQITVEVFPSSQLGRLQELAEAVSTGTIALSHNTAGAIGSLHAPFAALDTPYLYRDVDHLMKVMGTDSPVMQELNEGLITEAGVRVLYAYYFGTRHLTANQEVLEPQDLAGKRIRAIPFPIYMAAVEGLGAVAVPVDWSEVPTALATGVVDGQENPVNVAVSSNLFEVQSHMMLTGHIQAAHLIVINEDTWQSLPQKHQEALQAAAEEVRQRATQAMLEAETTDLEKLRAVGMTIVGPDDGLEIEAFRSAVQARIDSEFANQYGELYATIRAVD
jgi:TRAP-type transport system periplasmic protein